MTDLANTYADLYIMGCEWTFNITNYIQRKKLDCVPVLEMVNFRRFLVPNVSPYDYDHMFFFLMVFEVYI